MLTNQNLISLFSIQRLERYFTHICIFLVIGISNQAFPSEDVSKKIDSRKSVSDSTQNKPDIELKPITIVGDSPTPPLRDTKSTILKDRALHIQQSDTLGQTLEKELGISNASFGPGVGVPVIRGLTGSRIRTLQNGIGSHDAASLSPDHAVVIDPLFAEQIRILRGPETIRYGGNAIGGVIDVIDNRIPDRAPKNQIDGAVDNRYDTNGNGTNSAIKLNLGKILSHSVWAVHFVNAMTLGFPEKQSMKLSRNNNLTQVSFKMLQVKFLILTVKRLVVSPEYPG